MRNRTRLDASRASRASFCLDHVSLPVAVDPCPEPVTKREEPLVGGGQRANLQDTVRASWLAGTLGVCAGVVIATLAPGAVDGGDEKPRLLLFPALTHAISPRRRTATARILARILRRVHRSSRPAEALQRIGGGQAVKHDQVVVAVVRAVSSRLRDLHHHGFISRSPCRPTNYRSCVRRRTPPA